MDTEAYVPFWLVVQNVQNLLEVEFKIKYSVQVACEYVYTQLKAWIKTFVAYAGLCNIFACFYIVSVYNLCCFDNYCAALFHMCELVQSKCTKIDKNLVCWCDLFVTN